MKRLTVLIACIALTSALACKAEDDSPDLPPVASLNVDIAAMNGAPLLAKNAPTELTAAPEDYRNFANAWVRVRVVQFFAGAVVVLPAAAMAVALGQEPVRQGNLWIWSVSANDSTVDLEVRVGLVSGFDLDLYVTNTDLTRYLWVEGNFGDGTGTGEWLLHDPNIEGGDDRALSISWTYVSDTDRSLTYEILSPTANAQDEVFQGDTFTYSVDGTTATLEYVDADTPSETAVITWNTGSGAGSITVPGYNGGAAACWDDIFENLACP